MAVQVKHPQIFGYEIIFPKSNFSESSLIRYTWEALDHIDIVVIETPRSGESIATNVASNATISDSWRLSGNLVAPDHADLDLPGVGGALHDGAQTYQGAGCYH